MVDLCLEATQTTGPVSLFVGIEPETAHWSAQQFTDAGRFARSHSVTCIFLKCFEVGSPAGDVWYGGMAGVDTNINLIKAAGVNCIPYGFLYGGSQLSQEIDVAKQLLSKYGVLCLDMEGAPWASAEAASWAMAIAKALEPIPGELWVSCPANPVESGHMPFLQAMVPATNVFMPMVYTDSLATKWEADFKQIGASCIQPTIDLSGEFGPNNIPVIVAQILTSGAQALSIWEYQFAVNIASSLDQVMSLFNKQPTQGGSVQLNSEGCVCDIVQSYQLETGESQDLCGPWSVASLKYAGQPGKGATGTAEQVDQDADKEADIWLAGGHVAALGSTIENMHSFLHDNGLHYWDIAPDVAHITAAVKAGYAVLVTANEQNIKEKNTGKRPPYPWNLNVTHILPITGIDKDGDFISPDQLNNNFEGYWPVVYVASVLNPSWATVVQLVGPDAANPWLKQIPSGDPSTWPSGFNAQSFGGNVEPIPTPQPTAQEKQFQDIWNSTAPLFGGKPLDYTTGFAQDWQNKYMPKFFIGPPITKEFKTVDWNDQPITVQLFTNGMAQDNAGHHRWWVDDREITM